MEGEEGDQVSGYQYLTISKTKRGMRPPPFPPLFHTLPPRTPGTICSLIFHSHLNAFVKGAAGKPGSPGIPGVVGQKGESGTPGLVGYTGYQGDSGDTGPMGLKGTAGSDGEIGEQGPIGGKGSIVSKTIFLYCLLNVFRKYSYDNVPLISTGYLIDISLVCIANDMADTL